MSNGIALISIFTLAVFVGFEVVSKVSSTLHTPLMSGANAIHGVILVGAIIVASHSTNNLELLVISSCNRSCHHKYGWWIRSY